MCSEYYQLRAKLAEIYARASTLLTPLPTSPLEGGGAVVELDVMALKEIRLKMSAHIKNCPVCQENWKQLTKEPTPCPLP